MIRGIGCDVIEIERIDRAIKRLGRHFIERLFTPREIAYCEGVSQPAARFAGRFAAKEALAKALGCGIGSRLSWLDMEILNDEQGRPYVTWKQEIVEAFDIQRTHISISHSKGMAIAYAILEN